MGKTGENNQAPYYFHQGSTEKAYDYLGVHPAKKGYVFRTWAPNADFLSVVGDFNGWDTNQNPMTRVTDAGVWETTVENAAEGQNYKFYIKNGGRDFYKADPYGTRMQKPPETASVICDIEGFAWRDAGWLEYRKTRFTRENAARQPINIYEIHPGSWRRHEDGRPFSYTELATELATYVKEMGYTHVELMPICEHPFDGSWGYQICGYYAPTARFGTPKEFMAFVDTMHEAGVGVILDWVPAHFPKDAHGLCEFDGQPLYEYQGKDRMEHAGWGTRRFDVGRQEVQSFLVSNAFYWVEKYHADGLRVDAVASMLYLDYDKKPGEWIPNIYGGRECLEAVAFFQKLNGLLCRDHPDVMTIAEESTAFANVTRFSDGGLGFTMKWNMGWMNDSLSYLSEDPLWRCDHHNKLTFSMTYALSENYILPISHDEVVHGKKSLLDRNPGEYDQKFAGDRTFLAFLMTHPGKKLLFMGSEIGMFREWDCGNELEWFLLQYEKHAKLQLYCAELNHFYLEHPPLWEVDDDWSGFAWIDADNREQSIYSYRRIDRDGKELIVLLNFVPIKREDFLLAVPFAGTYEEVFNSDDARYGGSGIRNEGQYKTVPCMLRGYEYAIPVTVPPMSATIFRCVRKNPAKRQKRKPKSKNTKDRQNTF